MAPVRAALHYKAGFTAVGLIGTAFTTTWLLLVGILRLSLILWGSNIKPLSDPDARPGAMLPKPIPCSSHNDYWRYKPLHSALQAGCIGVEVDVWVFQDELYVGHNRDQLAAHMTLSALYINPLVKILGEKNQAKDPAVSVRDLGIFDIDPDQTLILLVDIKANPAAAWPLLLKNIEVLQSQGWLSYVSNGSFITGPITIVASGKTRFKDVEDNAMRNVFLDAPLAKLDDDLYNESNSYYASVSFSRSIGWVWSRGLRKSQLVKIRDQITKVHRRGLKVRYWGLPVWPLGLRNQLWGLLVAEGLDVLHVDDLWVAKDVLARG